MISNQDYESLVGSYARRHYKELFKELLLTQKTQQLMASTRATRRLLGQGQAAASYRTAQALGFNQREARGFAKRVYRGFVEPLEVPSFQPKRRSP